MYIYLVHDVLKFCLCWCSCVESKD